MNVRRSIEILKKNLARQNFARIGITCVQNFSLFLFSLIIIELLLRLTGMSYLAYLRGQVSLKSTQNREKIVLCIGESTTAWGGADSYPNRLQLRLDKIYGNGRFKVINAGHPGVSTGTLLQSLEGQVKEFHPVIAITMIGVNDFVKEKFESNPFDLKIVKFFRLLSTNAKILWPSLYGTNLKPNAKFVTPRPPYKPRPDLPLDRNNEYRVLVDKARALASANHLNTAVENLEKARGLFPLTQDDRWFYASLLASLGKHDSAEKEFLAFAEFDGQSTAYENIAKYYLGAFGQTSPENRIRIRNFVHRAVQVDPKNYYALMILAEALIVTNETVAEAHDLLLKAYALGCREKSFFNALLLSYSLVDPNSPEIDRISEEAIEYHPDTRAAWVRVLKNDLSRREFAKFENDYAKAVEALGESTFFENFKIEYKNLTGKEASKISPYDRLDYYRLPPTQNNYRKFAEILQQLGIRHVAMQYPRMEIESLKELLSNYPNTVFVENKTNFEQQLQSRKYEEIFDDRFADRFGHFSQFGADLIVDNIMEQQRKIFDFASEQN